VVSGWAAQPAALFATLLVECTAMALLSLFWSQQRRRLPANVATTAVVNLISHTLFWYALQWSAEWGASRLYWLELLVVVGEGSLYWWLRRFRFWEACLFSLLFNLLSWWVGVQLWFYWIR
jgi:hypothetical protein